MPAPISFEVAKKRLSKKYPHLILKKFSGVKAPCTISCKKHKITHTYAVYEMVKGCPDCAREKWRNNRKPKSQDVYKKQVKKGSKSRITVVGDYVNAYTKIDHKCLKCSTIWKTSPRSMLMHFGCKVCSHEQGQKTASKYKEHVLGRRKVKVQGSEPEALTFIVEKLGCKPSNIIVGSEGKVPAIQYTFNGKARMYRPDFFIKHKNRVVEVKSTWYFGLTNEDYYQTLVAKARACLAAGMDFRVIICNLKNSSPILLPKDWYEMSHKKFQKYWIKTYRLKLNGCRV